MVANWKRREVILGAAAFAASVGIDRVALASTGSAGEPIAASAGDPETDKRSLREHRETSQHHSLPSALPGEEESVRSQGQGLW